MCPLLLLHSQFRLPRPPFFRAPFYDDECSLEIKRNIHTKATVCAKKIREREHVGAKNKYEQDFFCQNCNFCAKTFQHCCSMFGFTSQFHSAQVCIWAPQLINVDDAGASYNSRAVLLRGMGGDLQQGVNQIVIENAIFVTARHSGLKSFHCTHSRVSQKKIKL